MDRTFFFHVAHLWSYLKFTPLINCCNIPVLPTNLTSGERDFKHQTFTLVTHEV